MLNMPNVAGIHILELPFSVDREYSYLIPSEYRSTIKPGHLVCVPFGRSNKLSVGVVADISQCNEPKGLKSISGFFTDCIIDKVSDEMMKLAFFMKETTFCSVGEAIRCMLPGGTLGRVDAMYFPAQQIENDNLSVESLKVYEYILLKNAENNGSGVFSEELIYNFGKEVKNEISKLLSVGMITLKHSVKSKNKEVTSKYVELTGDITQEILCALSRSPKQKEALMYISDYGSCSLRELQEKPGINTSTVNALVRKGIFRVIDVRRFRTPYSGEKTAESRENVLNEEQNDAYEKIKELCNSGKPAAALLHGVTGSGKTRVMKSVIDDVISRGKTVIVLVPEISLTPQTVSLFSSFYGNDIAVLHSSLSLGERLDEWQRIKDGTVKICIGTRSAVFAPLSDIGLIIIDEEQENTYKSENSPRYHARDIARFRCNFHSAVMLLSSATPSVESYYKAKNGAYMLLELKNRYSGAQMPETFIYDMRGHAPGKPLSTLLQRNLQKNIIAGEQSVLFINRRGYSNYCSCTVCNSIIKCPNCSVSLTYHTKDKSPVLWTDSPQARKENGYLVCHYCGYRSQIPDKCPDCGANVMHYTGYGTQYIEREIVSTVNGAKVLRLDADTTKTKYAFDSMLDGFRHGKENILLGTQMVTKGHDFPNVTLVGVISADCGQCGADYRANERTFALITQVIGRAGRAGKPGRAIIQTSVPDSHTIRLAAKQDYKAFYENEIAVRHALVFPPFCDLAALTFTSEDEKALNNSITRCCENIKQLLKNEYKDIQIQLFGPIEAPIYRLCEKMRMKIIMKCKANKRTRAFLAHILEISGKGMQSNVSISVDINPGDI